MTICGKNATISAKKNSAVHEHTEEHDEYDNEEDEHGSVVNIVRYQRYERLRELGADDDLTEHGRHGEHAAVYADKNAAKNTGIGLLRPIPVFFICLGFLP